MKKHHMLNALPDEKERNKRRTVAFPVKLIERNTSLPRTNSGLAMKNFAHETKMVN